MKVHLTSFGLPHREGVESHDAFAAKAREETVIAVLADGAGSSPAAGEAARRAVRSLMTNYETRPRSWTPSRALAEFTRLINRTMQQESPAHFGQPELRPTPSRPVLPRAR